MPFGGAPLSRNHCRRDSLSVLDIMRLMIMVPVPPFPSVLCSLQPRCRKLSKFVSVFGLSSRVAKVATRHMGYRRSMVEE